MLTYLKHNQVGEMMGNEIRPFLESRIKIPTQLCSSTLLTPISFHFDFMGTHFKFGKFISTKVT